MAPPREISPYEKPALRRHTDVQIATKNPKSKISYLSGVNPFPSHGQAFSILTKSSAFSLLMTNNSTFPFRTGSCPSLLGRLPTALVVTAPHEQGA